MAIESAYATDDEKLSAIDGNLLRATPLTLIEYDLTVPSGATINGITLTWTGGTSGGWDEDTTVMSINNGTSASTALSATTGTAVANATGVSTLVYGGATNLWGITWTVDQANAITTLFTAPIGQTGYHDAFQVTIYYTEILTGSTINLTSGLIQLTSGKISI
tara:strand:+ start:136 stop:624 length:489 start_codon:yes stop_codon:yes gene_type:complete